MDAARFDQRGTRHRDATVRTLTAHLDIAFIRGETDVCEMLIERLYQFFDDRADKFDPLAFGD